MASLVNIVRSPLPGILRITHPTSADARGCFSEIYQRERYAEAGIDTAFVQDNVSVSRRGALRGLHFQYPHAQAKLVSVVAGAIWDACVDVRVGSPTFGCWYGTELRAAAGEQVFIPDGFAHGFLSLEEQTVVHYKVSAAWHPECERTLLWNDPAVGVAWPQGIEPVLSIKDREGTPLSRLVSDALVPAFLQTA